MPTAPDALRTKTDAELLFFVENPSFYQSELVALAQQELRRRGALPPAPAATSYGGPAAGRRPVAASRLAGAGLLLVVAAVGLWGASRHQPASRPAARPGRLLPDSLKLESVVARPIPNFDLDQLTEAQLARIPAAEKTQAQELRQFRGLSRRFWAAETQTEFLTNQAHTGQTSPAFIDQTLLARDTWRGWNKAVVYRYHFGPAMQKQFRSMAQVASSQQHILSNLPALLPERRFLTDKELTARENDVQAWMADVRAASPVTGRPYRAAVLKFHP